jgi:hypothetical protein
VSFKGIIVPPASVECRLRLHMSASAPATLLASYARVQSAGTSEDGDIVMPGQGNREPVELDLDTKGILKVVVDMGDDADEGDLVVLVDGQEKTGEEIQGDVVWTYAVSAPDADDDEDGDHE